MTMKLWAAMLAITLAGPAHAGWLDNPYTPNGSDRNNPLSRVVLNATLEKTIFKAEIVLNLDIRNGNDFPVKDFVITCKGYGDSGTLIATREATLFQVLRGGATGHFTKFDMGIMDIQATKVHCEVSKVVMAD